MNGTAAKRVTTVIVVAIDSKDAGDAVPRGFVPWNYVIATPFMVPHDVVADELIVSKTMRDSPELYPLLKMLAPLFETTGGIEQAMERAEVPAA